MVAVVSKAIKVTVDGPRDARTTTRTVTTQRRSPTTGLLHNRKRPSTMSTMLYGYNQPHSMLPILLNYPSILPMLARYTTVMSCYISLSGMLPSNPLLGVSTAMSLSAPSMCSASPSSNESASRNASLIDQDTPKRGIFSVWCNSPTAFRSES